MPSRYERTDGAYVKESKDQYYSNPLNPRCRMWMAFIGADPNDEMSNGTPMNKARRRGSRFNVPRKWNTALNAMRAVDREYQISVKA